MTKKYGWFCVVETQDNDNNWKFDSLLDGVVFRSREDCETAINNAKEEDARKGWNYRYLPPNIVSLDNVIL